MRILIFSDIHGNLPAFEKMLQTETNIDSYISLGDVVNYGPWSNECVDLLESLEAVRLKGNHEESFINGLYPGKNTLVQSFFDLCYPSFNRQNEIANYIDQYDLGSFRFQHTINETYIFPDSVIETIGNYFIGHSHHQFDRQTSSYHVINVGSVGQNRKDIDIINFGVYDSETGQTILKSVHYKLNFLIDKMKVLNYPAICVDYYLKKLKVQ